MSSTETFPDSVLLKVFQFLSYEDLCLGVRMACRRWRTLSHDGSLWRYVVVPVHFTDVRFIGLLEQIHEHIEELDCSKCETLAEVGFNRMTELPLPRLKYLGVPLINVLLDEFYEKLAKQAPQLEQLENVAYNKEATCHPIECQQMFSQLKVLHDKPMSTYGRLRPRAAEENVKRRLLWMLALTKLATACREINSYHCRRGLDYLNDDSIERIAVIYPRLRILELHYCSVGDAGLEKFFAKFPGDLYELILDRPGDVTDKGLKLLADRCPNLERLKLSRILEMSNEGLSYVVSHCPHLKELHINNTVFSFEEDRVRKYNFNDQLLATIGASCPDLHNLRILYSNELTDIGISALAAGCKNLTGIMLYECEKINDACLKHLNALKHLRSAVLVNCDGITPRGLIHFILKQPILLRLSLFSRSDLFFKDMSSLADEVYEDIEKNILYKPNVLKKLTLKGVGGAFLQLITVLCPLLQTLDLREANMIGALSLCTVLNNCEYLEVLDIQSIQRLEDNFLHYLTRYAPNLRKLALGATVLHVSNAALACVIMQCPSLTCISMDTEGTEVDEKLMVVVSMKYHGGSCAVHIDPDDNRIVDEEGQTLRKHRYIEFHFTPIKYVASTTLNVNEEEEYEKEMASGAEVKHIPSGKKKSSDVKQPETVTTPPAAPLDPSLVEEAIKSVGDIWVPPAEDKKQSTTKPTTESPSNLTDEKKLGTEHVLPPSGVLEELKIEETAQARQTGSGSVELEHAEGIAPTVVECPLKVNEKRKTMDTATASQSATAPVEYQHAEDSCPALVQTPHADPAAHPDKIESSKVDAVSSAAVEYESAHDTDPAVVQCPTQLDTTAAQIASAQAQAISTPPVEYESATGSGPALLEFQEPAVANNGPGSVGASTTATAAVEYESAQGTAPAVVEYPRTERSIAANVGSEMAKQSGCAAVEMETAQGTAPAIVCPEGVQPVETPKSETAQQGGCAAVELEHAQGMAPAVVEYPKSEGAIAANVGKETATQSGSAAAELETAESIGAVVVCPEGFDASTGGSLETAQQGGCTAVEFEHAQGTAPAVVEYPKSEGAIAANVGKETAKQSGSAAAEFETAQCTGAVIVCPEGAAKSTGPSLEIAQQGGCAATELEHAQTLAPAVVEYPKSEGAIAANVGKESATQSACAATEYEKAEGTDPAVVQVPKSPVLEMPENGEIMNATECTSLPVEYANAGQSTPVVQCPGMKLVKETVPLDIESARAFQTDSPVVEFARAGDSSPVIKEAQPASGTVHHVKEDQDKNVATEPKPEK